MSIPAEFVCNCFVVSLVIVVTLVIVNTLIALVILNILDTLVVLVILVVLNILVVLVILVIVNILVVLVILVIVNILVILVVLVIVNILVILVVLNTLVGTTWCVPFRVCPHSYKLCKRRVWRTQSHCWHLKGNGVSQCGFGPVLTFASGLQTGSKCKTR